MKQYLIFRVRAKHKNTGEEIAPERWASSKAKVMFQMKYHYAQYKVLSVETLQSFYLES